MKGLDPAPLLALLGDVSDAEAARRLGVHPSAVSRWRRGKRLVSLRVADRLACRLGLHVLLIWPDQHQGRQ